MQSDFQALYLVLFYTIGYGLFVIIEPVTSFGTVDSNQIFNREYLQNTRNAAVIGIHHVKSRFDMSSVIPQPRAVGCVIGKILTIDPNTRRGQVELEDGTILGCSCNRKVLQELLHAPQMQRLTVFPEFIKDELFLTVWPSKNKEQQLGFRIIAEIFKIKEGIVKLTVRPPQRKQPLKLDVHGFLQANAGEYWKVEADIEQGKLVLIDAEKLADQPPPPLVSKAKQTITLLEESGPFVSQVPSQALLVTSLAHILFA